MYGASNYGAEVLLNPTPEPSGGMYLPDINPRGGVFGPQGFGDGIFDGMSGLGATGATDVRQWQALLNVELRDRGMNTIPVSGIVDEATCGATLALVSAYNAGETMYGALADAFDRGTGLEIAAQCSSIPQPWPEPKKRFGTMQMLMYGGAGAAAFLVFAVVMKKRKH